MSTSQTDQFIDKQSPNYRLMLAVLAGNLEQAKQSIVDGADIDSRVGELSGIHRSFYAFNYQIADFFIDAGANVNAVDFHGSMPLHLAALHGRSDLAVKLMLRGADRFAEDNLGRKPQELTPSGIEINWKYLSAEAERVMKAENGLELASLLLSQDKPTPALLEILGSDLIVQALTLPYWDTKTVAQSTELLDSIDKSLPIYWRDYWRQRIGKISAIISRQREFGFESTAFARFIRSGWS